MRMLTANLLVLLLFSGCRTTPVQSQMPSTWREVETGMMREDILRRVGQPNGIVGAKQEAKVRDVWNPAGEWWHVSAGRAKVWALGVIYGKDGRVATVLRGRLEISSKLIQFVEDDSMSPDHEQSSRKRRSEQTGR